MYRRLVEPRVREALTDTPVVLIVRPRRAGKTTLVRALEDGARPYLTLYDGEAIVPFGERLAAAPISSLWT
jgi:predicted AAA+ superfamily ATPase